MQVVEHEHQRALLGDPDDEPGDRLEELVALALGRAGYFVRRRHLHAQLRHEPAERAEVDRPRIRALREVVPDPAS